MSPLALPALAAAAAGFLGLAAEFLHIRRTRRIGHLAFPVTGRAQPWTAAVPWLRAAALAAIAWSLTLLALIQPASRDLADRPNREFEHLLVVLDVSPSMDLADAGPAKNQTRSRRASEIVLSLLDRVLLEQLRVSVIAVYSGALPVVEDTRDLAVVRNILNDLPLDHAFNHGRTRLFDGIREAAKLAAPWKRDSATLLILTDGVTEPDAALPVLPSSIHQTLIAGVGDRIAGRPIDGHQSRQETFVLSQLAARLRGQYYDCNEKHLPSSALTALAEENALRSDHRPGLREAALTTLALGATVVALLPVALALFGSTPLRRRISLTKLNPTTP